MNYTLSEFYKKCYLCKLPPEFLKIQIKGVANLTEEITLFSSVDLDVDLSEIDFLCQMCMYANLISLLLYITDIPTNHGDMHLERKK